MPQPSPESRSGRSAARPLLAVLAALCACALLAGGAAAQTTNAAIPVAITLQTSLGAEVTGTTDFGAVHAASGTVTLDPSAPAAGMAAARVTMTGNPGGLVQVHFLASAVALRRDGDPGAENGGSFQPAMSHLETLDQANSVALASGNQVTLDPSGLHYLWIGGSVAVAPSAPAGIYTGILTLSLSY